MRSAGVIAVALVGALALVGCSAEPTTEPVGATSSQDGDQSAQPEADRSPDSTTAAPDESTPAPEAERTSDYVRLDGEDLPLSFEGYTLDPDHDLASVVESMSMCHADHGGTGVFRAVGWMVDENNDVMLNDDVWLGHAYISLPFDGEAAAESNPVVQLELNERGVILNTEAADPAAIEGTFTVDGDSATGDFMVPDLGGGPDRRVEFHVTCLGAD